MACPKLVLSVEKWSTLSFPKSAKSLKYVAQSDQVVIFLTFTVSQRDKERERERELVRYKEVCSFLFFTNNCEERPRKCA